MRKNTILKHKIHLENAMSCLCTFLCESIVIQCLSVDQLYKGQLAELPTILDSFYTTITNDHIGVEVGGGGSHGSGGFFHVLKLTLLENIT